jgi:RNA-binding protein
MRAATSPSLPNRHHGSDGRLSCSAPYNHSMPTPLTTRERAHLKARAHALEPVVHVGHAGVTPELIAETDRALTAHELIKVRITGDDRAVRHSVGDELAAETDASVVHRVGKVLILWRPRPQEA